MNRKEQLEAIRAACIKANPEIKPWSDKAIGYTSKEPCGFGCGRLWNEKGNFNDCPSVFHEGQRCPKCIAQERLLQSGCTGITCTSSCPCVRPIRLADVINALQDQKQDYLPDNTISILCQAQWNLRKDDLAEQSDECVAFLAELLA